MAEWHCSVGGQQYGPISEDQLRAWVAQGRVSRTDLVWTEGMSEWAPASSVGGLFQSAPAGPAGASPQPAAAYTYARPHRGGAILALGIVSIVVALTLWCSLAGLICGIIALNMSKKDLPLLQAGQMDPRGLGITQAGRICGIVGTILSSLMLVLLLVYVIFIVGMFAHM